MPSTTPNFPTFTPGQQVLIYPYDECKSLYERYKSSPSHATNRIAYWMILGSDGQNHPYFISAFPISPSNRLVHPLDSFTVVFDSRTYVLLKNDDYLFNIHKTFVHLVDDSIPASPISFDSLLGGI